jgi:hypothetical protein
VYRTILVLFLVFGCSSPVVVNDDNDVIVEVAKAQSGELKLQAKRTVCLTKVAAELDPQLQPLLRAGFAYWADLPDYNRYELREPGECDVPVYFADETFEWKGEEKAGTLVVGELKPGVCVGNFIAVRESTWNYMRENAWQYVAIVHEIGHLFCKPHVEDKTDVMSKYGGLPS